MAAPMPEPAYLRAADLVILFYIYGQTLSLLRTIKAKPNGYARINAL